MADPDTIRTQEFRPMAISTALGPDVLLLRRATIIEQLGRPFQIDAEVLSESAKIDFAKIVGTNATIRLDTTSPQGTRYFNGFVSRFAYTGGTKKTSHYRMTISPWLWFLTRTTDCRIFQNMKIPDIIQQVFRDYGFTNFDDALKLKGDYEQREYVVQYRETAFNFVSRLMEDEGIYYYWDHKDGKHVLVLADDRGSHTFYPDYKNIPYYPFSKVTRDEEYVWDWIVEQEIQPGHFTLRDYDFEKVRQDMNGKADLKRDHAQPDFHIFDYPAGYKAPSFAESAAKDRLNEFQAAHEVVRGRGDVRGLAVGYTFTLDNFPVDTWDAKEYLVTSAVHELESDDYDSSGEDASDVPQYRVSFNCILASQPFRPRRLTVKPLISGPQTAFVVGPSGEEIHTDKYGRIKVRFHWDRNPAQAKPEDLSCWTRVAQTWAGKQWGSMCLPRVGHEVVVEFLEGDPDRPIVTGSVYNGDNMPPYALPDNKTRSVVKSNSSKGGGGFNEIRIEDKKGEEQVFIHGEKNEDIRIKNDAKEWIGNDRHLVVVNDQLEHVKHDRHEKVDNDHFEAICRDRHLHVLGKECIGVDKDHSFEVIGEVVEKFAKSHSEEVSNDYTLQADNICIKAKTNITIKVGNTSIAIDDKSITIDSPGTIDFKAKQDITTKADMNLSSESGMSMKQKAGLSMNLEGGAAAELKSPSTTVKGDGMLTLKGGVTMIN
jgi:type VI secretion system secreted protein VgrG